jgi:hypothetical protein
MVLPPAKSLAVLPVRLYGGNTGPQTCSAALIKVARSFGVQDDLDQLRKTCSSSYYLVYQNASSCVCSFSFNARVSKLTLPCTTFDRGYRNKGVQLSLRLSSGYSSATANVVFL